MVRFLILGVVGGRRVKEGNHADASRAASLLVALLIISDPELRRLGSEGVTCAGEMRK